MTVSPNDPRPPKSRPGQWRDVALDLAVKVASIGLVEWVKHAYAQGWLPLL